MGNDVFVKLADFGLAKNFELAGLSQLTGDHEIRGTPAFMPWEQLTGSRYAKPTADIYSTAATLYYFLTGRPPGHTQPSKRSWLSVTALFAPGRKVEPAPSYPDLDAALGEIPRGLTQVLARALAANPKDRFPSAAEMRHALLPFADLKG
jgi:serine/threonine protein kinase